jgi:rRNA processing protein Krr1/Pno1
MEIITKNLNKIIKNKKKIEKILNITLMPRGNRVILDGEQVDLFIAENVFRAIEAGFSVRIALLLADPDYLLEELNIKNFTKRKNLSLVRARIIGKNGQTLDLMGDLSNCFIKLHENTVYIIGKSEDIKKGINSATKIIQGSKQSSVYAYLEKQNRIMHEGDLGLKESHR